MADEATAQGTTAERIGKHGAPARAKKRHPVRTAILAVVAVIVVVALVCAVSVLDMSNRANAILDKVSAIQDDVLAGEYTTADADAKELQQMAVDLGNTLNNPLWSAIAAIPQVTRDIDIVRQLSGILENVSTDSLVPLMSSLAENPPSGLIDDGKINVEETQKLISKVQEISPALETAQSSLDSLPASHFDAINEAVDSAGDKLGAINEKIEMLNTLAPIIGDLLGKDGKRTYLVVAQGSNELRACGGFAGAYGLINVEDGAISLSDFAGAEQAISDNVASSLKASDLEYELFGKYYMTNARNINFCPSFPRCAQVWSASYIMYHYGTQIDGVISVVPAVVQDLLAITGAITLSDGTVLDGTNATKVLQSDLYWKYMNDSSEYTSGNATSDSLFSEAAQLAFKSVFSNLSSSTLVKLAGSLVEDATTREIMVYSANEAEEEVLKLSGMSGALNFDETKPELGVYVSTGMAGKLAWYVDVTTTIGEPVQNADGSVSYRCSTTLHNNLTKEIVSQASSYIVGYVDPGEAWPWLHVFAPMGGKITNFVVTQGKDVAKESSYEGLQVVYMRADDGLRLGPGETISVTYVITTSPNATHELALSTTPTLTQYRIAGETAQQ